MRRVVRHAEILWTHVAQDRFLDEICMCKDISMRLIRDSTKLALFPSLVLLFGLTSCNSAQPDVSAAKPAAEDSVRIDAPIPVSLLKTAITEVGPRVYYKQADALFVQIKISNNGPVTLANSGNYPVQLGATLAGPDGVDKPPGNRNFKRLGLPVIRPRSSVTVDVFVPARAIVGLELGFDLVQENVAWFSWYSLPALDAGTFSRCSGAANTLCDDSGVPVSSPPESALFKHPPKRAF
jgi:hypothetical protein